MDNYPEKILKPSKSILRAFQLGKIGIMVTR